MTNFLVLRHDILLQTLVFLPRKYAAGKAKRWPVLCFLHGRDECAPLPALVALTLHGPLRPGSSQRARDDFIVVAPQLPSPGGNVWGAHQESVRNIVRAVRAEYGGDDKATYLTGFSYGGNGVFDIALKQPDFWAALWPVDPPGVPARNPGRPIWLSLGEYSRKNQAACIRVLGVGPLKAKGKKPDGDFLFLDEGQGHVDTATSAYQDDRIYDWLRTKRLP